MEYDWPGNVRELENLVKRTVVLGTEAAVRKEIGLGFAVAQRRMSRRAASAGGQPRRGRVPRAAAGRPGVRRSRSRDRRRRPTTTRSRTSRAPPRAKPSAS